MQRRGHLARRHLSSRERTHTLDPPHGGGLSPHFFRRWVESRRGSAGCCLCSRNQEHPASLCGDPPVQPPCSSPWPPHSRSRFPGTERWSLQPAQPPALVNPSRPSPGTPSPALTTTPSSS